MFIRSRTPRVDWHGWWYHLELRFRIKAGFDASVESSVVIKRYNAVSLKPGHTYLEVEKFLLAYEDARTEMIRVGQLRPVDYQSVQREILDIQEKMFGTALLGWLKRQDLRGIYLVIDDQSEEGHGYSLFGRIRQYVDAEKAGRGIKHELKPQAPEQTLLNQGKSKLQQQLDAATVRLKV